MRPLRLLPAVLALVMGCASASSPSTPAPSPPEAEAPGPIVCDEGSYATSAGTCARYPSLSVTRAETSIAPPRDHHTSIVIETDEGAFLYVVGGTDAWSVLHDDVQRARLHEDGRVGAFESVGKLPDPRAGHCIVRSKDRLYVFGGVVGGPTMGPSASSVVLTLGADGKVTSSAKGPELPKPVMHLTCDLAGDYVYALGGRGKDGRSTALSARARIATDGAISAFEPQTPLSPDRSHHGAFVRERRLYVLGGLTGDPTRSPKDRKDVVFADIADDGTLGAWTPAGSLPASLSVSSAQLYEDAVYVFGGLEDGAFFTDKIRRATFSTDGTLADFATLETRLPDPRGHVHQTPVWRDLIYSVGGKDMQDRSLGAIDVGRFEAR